MKRAALSVVMTAVPADPVNPASVIPDKGHTAYEFATFIGGTDIL